MLVCSELRGASFASEDHIAKNLDSHLTRIMLLDIYTSGTTISPSVTSVESPQQQRQLASGSLSLLLKYLHDVHVTLTFNNYPLLIINPLKPNLKTT